MWYVVNWNVTLLLTLGPFLPHDRSYSRQFLLTASCEPLIRRVKVLELVSWGNTRSVPISHCQFVPFPTSNWTENEIPGRWLLHAAPKSQVRVVVMVGVCHVPKCHHKPTNPHCTMHRSKYTVEESQTNVTSAIMPLFEKAIWGHIWKRTVVKSWTNAFNVTLPLLGQAIWEDIWKRTVEESQTNVTSAIMPLFEKAIWGHIWKRTVVKSWTNAINVTMHLLGQTFWGHFWKRTMEKSQTNVTNVILHPLWGHVWKHTVEDAGDLRRLKIHSGEKLNKCNQCYFGSSHAGNLRRHLKMYGPYYGGEKECN